MDAATITYRETTSQMRRVFKLNQTSVEVELKSLNRDAQDVVNLADLRPEPERLQVRQIVPLRLGGTFFIVGMVSLSLGFSLQSGAANELKRTAIITGIVSLILGGLILLLFGAKIQAVRFKNSTGICLLDVLKSGPDKSQYEAFVSALIDRIRMANRTPDA